MRDKKTIEDKYQKVFNIWLTTEDVIYKLYLRGVLDSLEWVLEKDNHLVEESEEGNNAVSETYNRI